tara:strand:- start:143 stop:364 length:222 start_codon:yes stop_codon:yes gene_type:complete
MQKDNTNSDMEVDISKHQDPFSVDDVISRNIYKVNFTIEIHVGKKHQIHDVANLMEYITKHEKVFQITRTWSS